jgi:YrbI family 3-deoxy-D-manno-octulosonate 8-phosphate phosphatase
MDENLKKRLEKIKLVAMDIDGTLTDGAMYYSAEGDLLKRFYVRDGMGIDLLHKSGIMTAFITSEKSEIVTARAKKLKITKVILGTWTKGEDLERIAVEFGLKMEEIAFIGDDVNDIPAFNVVGFRICPNDASPLVHEFVDFISTKDGGNGAVRELAEMILKSKNISLF